MQVAPFSIFCKPVPRRLAVPLAISSFRTEFFLPSKPTIISGADALPAGKKWFDRIDDRTRRSILTICAIMPPVARSRSSCGACARAQCPASPFHSTKRSRH